MSLILPRDPRAFEMKHRVALNAATASASDRSHAHDDLQTLFIVKGRDPYKNGATAGASAARHYDATLKGDYLKLCDASCLLTIPVPRDNARNGASLILQFRLPPGPIQSSPDVVLEHASVSLHLDVGASSSSNSHSVANTARRLDVSTAIRRALATVLHAQLPLPAQRGVWTTLIIDVPAHAAAAFGSSESCEARVSRVDIKGAIDIRAAFLLCAKNSSALPDAALFPIGSLARVASAAYISGSLDWERASKQSSHENAAGPRKPSSKKMVVKKSALPQGGSPGEDTLYVSPQGSAKIDSSHALGAAASAETCNVVNDSPPVTAAQTSPAPLPRSPLLGLATRSAARRALIFDLLKSPHTADALSVAVSSSPATCAMLSDADDRAPATRLPVLRSYSSAAVQLCAPEKPDTEPVAAITGDVDTGNVEEDLLRDLFSEQVADKSTEMLHTAPRSPRSPPPPPPLEVLNPWAPRGATLTQRSPKVRVPKRVFNSPAAKLGPRSASVALPTEDRRGDAYAAPTPQAECAAVDTCVMTPQLRRAAVGSRISPEAASFAEADIARRLDFDGVPLPPTHAATQTSPRSAAPVPAPPPVNAHNAKIMTVSAPGGGSAAAAARAASVAASAAAAASTVAAAAAELAAQSTGEWHAGFIRAYQDIDAGLDKLLQSL